MERDFQEFDPENNWNSINVIIFNFFQSVFKK